MSYTIVHRTPLDAAGSLAVGLAPVPFNEGLFKTTREHGRLESPILETPAPFDRLVGSWNARIPENGYLVMQARARGANGWSPWFELGRQKGRRFFSPPRQESAFGFVDEDTLMLRAPATALRYRVLLSAADPRAKPAVLILAAVSVSDGKTGPEKPFAPGPWIGELKVSPRSQMTEQARYRRDICSPTSLAMALSFWGRNLATAGVARNVRDETTKDYGNWSFNAAFAGSPDFAAYFSYLSSLRDIQREIAHGRPVVASLTFGDHELTGSPIPKTKGHLVLATGFTRAGDVIVLDPAAPSAKFARRVYPRAQFRKAWLVNKRGASYLMGPLAGRRMTVGTAAADLMARPRARPTSSAHDSERLSQLLYGETASVVFVRGGWAFIKADEQPRFSKGRWSGYSGWIKSQDLRFSKGPTPNAVVAVKKTAVQWRGHELFLSLGTRVQTLGSSGGKTTIRLLDGTAAAMPKNDLKNISAMTQDRARRRILAAARLFLGLDYVWGGRSGVQERASWGVDCSGLSSLAYRAAGLDIPRDAADQKRRAKPVSPKVLRPGDLVFLGGAGGLDRVTHVLIYSGKDSYIESRKTGGGTIMGTFSERFGKPLRLIKPGELVMDQKLAAPRRRRIDFGSYF
ncbi:MAG: C39 family peptidase [Elusimicrobiota bacterium]